MWKYCLIERGLQCHGPHPITSSTVPDRKNLCFTWFYPFFLCFTWFYPFFLATSKNCHKWKIFPGSNVKVWWCLNTSMIVNRLRQFFCSTSYLVLCSLMVLCSIVGTNGGGCWCHCSTGSADIKPRCQTKGRTFCLLLYTKDTHMYMYIYLWNFDLLTKLDCDNWSYKILKDSLHVYICI